MPITVELQDMRSYSFVLVLIVVMLTVVLIGISIFVFLRGRKKSPGNADKKETVMPVAKPVNSNTIKQKYCAAIMELEKRCHANQISSRHAYQELSQIVRYFVYEMTGVKVQNYTLEEMKRMNMPKLYAMIAEYYIPEFATGQNGDIYASLNKAKKVVEGW